jgi:hypothetical protein
MKKYNRRINHATKPPFQQKTFRKKRFAQRHLLQMQRPSCFNKKRSVKSGLPRGTLVHIGDQSDKTVPISFFARNI